MYNTNQKTLQPTADSTQFPLAEEPNLWDVDWNRVTTVEQLRDLLIALNPGLINPQPVLRVYPSLEAELPWKTLIESNVISKTQTTETNPTEPII